MQTYDNAKSVCLQQESDNPSVIMINSLEEQQFIEQLLFDDNKIVDNVWLGAKRDSKTKKFNWDDVSNSSFTYENWGKPNNNNDFECAEMIPYGKEKGKWTNTSCKRNNLIVCQKMQRWTLARFQRQFLDSKKQCENQMSELKNIIEKNHEKFENEINKLKNANSIPIDFIYVQLPFQAEPTSIWPKLSWIEISDNYENLFFRVKGHKTAPYGHVQEESTSRLSKVNITYVQKYIPHHNNMQDNITAGIWSQLLYTGAYTATKNQFQYIHFYVSDDEVRPKNTAIKIWKRIQ